MKTKKELEDKVDRLFTRRGRKIGGVLKAASKVLDTINRCECHQTSDDEIFEAEEGLIDAAGELLDAVGKLGETIEAMEVLEKADGKAGK